MRVISGAAKGRRLFAPRGRKVRPTADRVKEALFAILGDVSGKHVLDLYAGSGALGIEALSRGAAHCLFVDSDSRSVAAVRRNLAETGFASAATAIRADAARAIERLSMEQASFDLIFVDPPYRINVSDLRVVLRGLLRVMAPGGVLVLEHRSSLQPIEVQGLAVVTRRKYGDSSLTFYRY